jgi:tetratricopeptide (TPR) repeat protein
MLSPLPLVLALALLAPVAPLFGQGTAAAQEHAEKALQFAQAGDLKSAETELRKAVALSPGDPALLTSLGGILGMEGNLLEANTYLAKAVKLNPQDPASRRNLAANQWQLGQLKEAHENLDRLVRANPRDKIALFLLGMVSERQKDYRRSTALLESVPEVMERQPDGWIALASSYYHTNRREDARKTLRRLVGRGGNTRIAFLGGQAAMDAQDYQTAEALFATARSTASDPAVVEFEIAMAQYRDGRAAQSEKTLLEAIQAKHAHSDAYVLLCKVLVDQGGDIRALRFAAQAVQAFPDAYDAVSMKGSLEMKLRYYNEAVTSYEKAVKLKPESAGAKRDLASAQWRAGMRERAVLAFEQAMRQFPRDAMTYQVYGTLLVEDATPESRSHAAGLFERAIALDNSSAESRYQLANIEMEDGKPERALPHLEGAIKLNPQDSRFHFALSRVYRRLGRSSEADKEMEIYQKLKQAQRPEAGSDSAQGTQR